MLILGVLVGEVDRESESELPGVDRVMRHGEIVIAKQTLINMAPQHEESYLIKFCSDVGICKSEIADPCRIISLDME